MKTDGSIIIDTKIIDGGMEKGFELIKDEMSSVGMSAKKVGEQIELSFSKMDVSKPIANAVARVQQLESQLEAITADFKNAVSEGDDKSAERLASKRISIYERLEAAREKLSLEIAHAVQKESDAETRAAEKTAAAKKRVQEKQYRDATKGARRFNTRLREIVSGALVFNLISAGLRNVTRYFGNALKSNKEFATSFSQLKGALLTAFQPIYEVIAPAIIYLMRLLTAAAQAIGRFFSVISGKSYSQMQKNAKSLYSEANAIEAVGGAAKEAKKQLAAFDEINRLESTEQGAGGGVGAASGAPLFESVNIPSEWESKIDSLALRVKDIFFNWDDLTPEIIAEKIVTALAVIAGGLIGFALGGPHGALIGMTIGAGLGVVLSNIIFDGDGELSTSELVTALVSGLAIIGGAVIGFAVGGAAGAAIGATVGSVLSLKIANAVFDGDGITAGELLAGCVAALMAIGGAILGFAVGGPAGAAIGAVVGLGLTMMIEETKFDAVAESIKTMLENVRDYFSEAFSDGFISGVETLVLDAMSWLENAFVDFINLIVDTWWAYVALIGGGGVGTTPDYSVNSRAASYSNTPDVPHLAKGAVIPANNKFLAVLGDQTSGRNLEAPEDLIRQIVREESGVGSSDRVAQLLEALISVVEGIEVGDEVIGKAAARYNRSAARARGY